MTELKLILAGLGGQGVVFMTRLFSQAAISSGQEVMVSETHGMSQRGGSVVSHLQVSGSHAPLIRKGTADMILALEGDEALRNLPFLRSGGIVFVNSETGLRPELDDYLEAQNIQVHAIRASQMAMDLKFPAVANVVLVGFASGHPAMPFRYEILKKVIRIVAKRGLEINLEALELGYQAGKKLLEKQALASADEEIVLANE